MKAAYGSATPTSATRDGVVRVAVAVRVDRALEAGDQLVGARVDERPPARRRLPAGDADRQDRRAGRGAVQAAGAAGAGEEPGELGAVPLDLRRVAAGSRARLASSLPFDDVEPRQDLSAEIRMGEVDAGVEQRDRDAAAVVARAARRGPVAASRPNAFDASSASDDARPGTRRGPGRRPTTSGIVLEQRDRARVESRREAVEHARVAEVGLHVDAVRRERRQHLLLRGVRPATSSARSCASVA